tara:strand:- start:542 stop:1285 length:744 start_codon:yes stop_codon:yes gene_type:complete
MHITFISRNQEIRISSFLIIAKEYSKKIRVIGVDCNDNSESYCDELGCVFSHSDGKNISEKLREATFESNLLVINLDRDMSLKKFKDILETEIKKLKSTALAVKDSNKIQKSTIIDLNEGLEKISWIFFDKIGFNNFISKGEINEIIVEKTTSLDKKTKKIKSIKNISKNIKNPLFLFGVPGLFMILTSFILVYNVIGKYDSIDSVSMGTAFVTIGATVLGMLSLMSAIISYILGKQTEFILTNYSD